MQNAFKIFVSFKSTSHGVSKKEVLQTTEGQDVYFVSDSETILSKINIY